MRKPDPPPYYLSAADAEAAKEDAAYVPRLEPYVAFLTFVQRYAPAALTAICNDLPGNPADHARMDLYARSRRVIRIQPTRGKDLRQQGEAFQDELTRCKATLAFLKHRAF